MMKYFKLDPNSISSFYPSKAATASNLSSVGGNSTSSVVVKLRTVAELVRAEYIETVSNDKPFSDWC